MQKNNKTKNLPLQQIFENARNYKGILFIDRDGTINKIKGYLHKKGQLELLPNVTKGIQLLNKSKIAVVVITNQPAVAHGLMTVEELSEINKTLVLMLKKENAYIDAIYSCIHHPNGTVTSLSIDCLCRKPSTLLSSLALDTYKTKKIIGMIGDSWRDIQFGKNINIPTVTVLTGNKGQDPHYNGAADFIAKDFLQSVEKLLKLL